jgi:hypothetical protein
MMSMKAAACAASLLCLFAMHAASPASAQDGPVGIAFAEAPEQSSGVCTGQSTDKTLACARTKCVEGGAMAEDCLRVKWCYPAGWSADLFIQHKEGVHWHEYLCGWHSKEALMAAIDVACGGERRDYIIECSAVRFWDDKGREIEPN